MLRVDADRGGDVHGVKRLRGDVQNPDVIGVVRGLGALWGHRVAPGGTGSRESQWVGGAFKGRPQTQSQVAK